MVHVRVGHVVERLGEPEGLIAFEPSSFPKRGTHAVGVQRPWGGHRGKGATGQGGVVMGDVSPHDPAVLDCRLSLPADWVRDEPRRQEGPVPPDVRSPTRHEQC